MSEARELAREAIEEFREVALEDTSTDLDDLIFEIADAHTPVYNREIMEVAASDPEVFGREPEGGRTLIKLAGRAIFDYLRENLYTVYREVEEERERQQGPGAGDYVLSPTGHLGSRIVASEVEGRWSHEFATTEEATEAVRQRMERERFWPNVWWQDDHGGLSLVES